MSATLRILGGVSLAGPEGPIGGRVAQRRHLALLSVLALSRETGTSRDKLIALFWPEAGTERARQYLSISVYVIRQALGQDAIVSTGDDLRLNGQSVSVDAVEFRSALLRGEIDAAAALYQGPLLDGFHLNDAPDFERWIDAERQKLDHELRTALETAATEATARQDSLRAAELWRRLATLDPLNTRVALGLMTALAAAGDRTRALQHARVHAALLRDELGVDTDPEIAALAERLRVEPETTVAPMVAYSTMAHPTATDGVAPAQPDPAPDTGHAPETPAPAHQGPTFPVRTRARRLQPFLLAASLLLAAGVALFVVARQRVLSSTTAIPAVQIAAAHDARPAVAVLAFENLSSDTLDIYLAEGIREEIAARLSRIAWLRVRSRNAGASFIEDGERPELGNAASRVDFLVGGSVRGSGNRVKIGVSLTRTTDGFRIWSDEFSGGREDLLTLQEQIAGQVVTLIGGKLYPWDRSLLSSRPTANAAAYDHFIRGNYHLARRTPESVRLAIAEYRSAVQLDSGFTAALARQGYAYALFPDWGWEYPGETHAALIQRGLTIAEQALRQEPGLAEAWLARAYLLVQQDPYRMSGALEAFERAIALDPVNAETFHQYGQTLMVLGRDAEAQTAYEQAIALEPGRIFTMVPLFAIHFHRRQFSDAERWLERAVAVDSTVGYLRAVRALLRLELGDVDGARADALAALRFDPAYQVPARSMLARVFARTGQRDEAAAHITPALQSVQNAEQLSPTDARFIASALLESARADEALDILTRARPQGAWLWFYLQGPDFDRLRRHPGFQRIVASTRPDS